MSVEYVILKLQCYYTPLQIVYNLKPVFLIKKKKAFPQHINESKTNYVKRFLIAVWG